MGTPAVDERRKIEKYLYEKDYKSVVLRAAKVLVCSDSSVFRTALKHLISSQAVRASYSSSRAF